MKLLFQKVTAKDLAKFSVTHKGQLSDYLNSPLINKDKACARLLLHKALQDKYKFLRTTFTDIAIDDLLMSREERKKMKIEAKEKSKEKQKKNKDMETKKTLNEGNWCVEDVNMDSSNQKDNEKLDKTEDLDTDNISNDEDEISHDEENEDCSNNEMDIEESYDKKANTKKENTGDLKEKEKFKLEPKLIVDEKISLKSDSKSDGNNKKKQNQTHKNNRKLAEKILGKKFNKEQEPQQIEGNKIVDPFFKTSTGENYMSLVEPRPPDEVKDVHKQGNRKLRRAAMFGHVPKIKPRREPYGLNNRNGFKENKSKVTDNSRWNKGNSFNESRDDKFNNRTVIKDKSLGKDVQDERNKRDNVPEKLHPSWEAKKRQSGLLPFEGKKIVFD